MKQKQVRTDQQDFFSIPQAAKLLGISRIAVYKKVIAGKIKAHKAGRQFVIPKEELPSIDSDAVQGKALSEKEKQMIQEAVHKTVKEYGEVLELLGKE
jgi:excisionase family DNA binding protein